MTNYVIDSGVRLSHNDFTGRVRTAPDYVDDDASSDDCHGHGTHVAGTASGTNYGVAKRSKIVAVRVLDCTNSGWYSDWISAIDWINADHATGVPAVVNASLGGGYSSALNQAVSNSISDGIVWVVAAMNNASDACSYSPASVPSAITVGATDRTDTRASFSNYGSCVDIFAPGVDITSAGISTDTAEAPGWSGTSMATPHVVGAVARYWGEHPGASAADASAAVLAAATTDKVSDPQSVNRLLYVDPGTQPAVHQLSVKRSGTGSGTVTSAPAGINCGTICSASFTEGSAVTLTAAAASGSVFGGWHGACSGTSNSCTVTMSAAKNVSAAFNTASMATTFQESSQGVALNGWDATADAAANGGSYRSTKVVGDFALHRFTGTAVTWLTRKGPFGGIATVSIDGVNKGTVDLYAPGARSFSKTFTGLTSAAHTIEVTVTGKNRASQGFNVMIDGFQVGTTIYQDTSPRIAYNKWNGVTATAASGGAYRVTTTSASTSTLRFTGTSVDWITAMGATAGKAQVFIDGVDKGVVDLYRSTQAWKVARTYSGLASGKHTIVVKALGTKNAKATGTKVVVDGFTVRP